MLIRQQNTKSCFNVQKGFLGVCMNISVFICQSPGVFRKEAIEQMQNYHVRKPFSQLCSLKRSEYESNAYIPKKDKRNAHLCHHQLQSRAWSVYRPLEAVISISKMYHPQRYDRCNPISLDFCHGANVPAWLV